MPFRFELPHTTCPRYIKKINTHLATKYGVQNVHIYDVPSKLIYIVNLKKDQQPPQLPKVEKTKS
jgi:hypothetical protein